MGVMKMNEKCPTCVTGNLERSGSHMFCDNCNFSMFVMTPDYMSAASGLLAELFSNTAFRNNEEFEATASYHIATHLPLFSNFLERLESGKEEFLTKFLITVKDTAINLQIGAEVLNEEENNDLRCSCGETQFNQIKVGELACRVCEAIYKWDEDKSKYMPWFLCVCGDTKVNFSDDGSNLCSCGMCDKLYMYNKRNDTFIQVLMA
jgi:hypothetical protein